MNALIFSVEAFLIFSAVVVCIVMNNRDKQEKADPKRERYLDFRYNLLQAQKERKGMARIHKNQLN